MASILDGKLNEILTEKNQKIIPENIRKGVQIFDIIGTLAASGTVSSMTRYEITDAVDLSGLP